MAEHRTSEKTISDLIIESMRESIDRAIKNAIGDLSNHLGKELNIDPRAVQDSINNFNGRPQKRGGNVRKISPDEGIVIVLNYGPRSHAIFGNTREHKGLIKEIKSPRGSSICKYMPRTDYGPGWLVMDKDCLNIIEETFKEHSIEYTIIDRDDARAKDEPEKIASPTRTSSRKNIEEDEDSIEVPRQSRSSSRCRVSGSRTPHTLVMRQLPVGIRNRKIDVAIAMNVNGQEVPLDADEKRRCENEDIPYLTSHMLEKLKNRKELEHLVADD